MWIRYLKAQGFVLLCGGLVGPVFLAVFFLLGREPLLKWMFWVGLLVTAADVLIALALTNYDAKHAASSTFLEQTGVLALARITGIAETGAQVNEQPLVKLSLHVEGPGLVPFDAEDRVLAPVSRLPMISGRQLVALVDPATNAYQIDWDRSALLNGVVPAQFTIDDEGKTYDLSGHTGPLLDIMRILKANNIPMTGTIDIRSNPDVGEEVMRIVHAAAGPQAPRSVADRLAELDVLRGTGTITDGEYTAKRRQIIGEL